MGIYVANKNFICTPLTCVVIESDCVALVSYIPRPGYLRFYTCPSTGGDVHTSEGYCWCFHTASKSCCRPCACFGKAQSVIRYTQESYCLVTRLCTLYHADISTFHENFDAWMYRLRMVGWMVAAQRELLCAVCSLSAAPHGVTHDFLSTESGNLGSF